MNVAVCFYGEYHREDVGKRLEQYPYFRVEYFQKEEILLRALNRKHYELIFLMGILHTDALAVSVKRIHEKCSESIVAYIQNQEGWEGRYCSRFVGKFDREILALDLDEIYGFEAYDRKINIHTSAGPIRVTTKLEEEERKLPPLLFVRINQGWIINMKYIKAIDGNRIQMRNNQYFYISERRKKRVLDSYRKYCSNYFIK